MKPLALAGALAGGILGALAWAVVACATGYEIGYLAWGVGGLVGFGSWALGGRGQAAACTCAGIALLAILLGRVFTIQRMVEAMGPGQIYDHLLPQAEEFVNLQSDDECARFLVEHHYTNAPSAQEVRAEEVEAFRLTLGPILEDLGKNRPSAQEWKERPLVKAYFQAATEEPPVFGILWGSLSPVDLIFAFLGIVTAYRVCMRPGAVPEGHGPSCPAGGLG